MLQLLAEGKTIEYDSQTDITPKNFADLNNYIGPLNRPFTLTVSPYGEVSAIEGDEIEFDVEIPDYELQGITTFGGLADKIVERR